jgi:formylglycine-generating enzyme required for sulfatase activity
LVAALRHCDGEHVQAVVLVRDDFWLAASRFMRDLEIRLVEAENSSLVDLFDLRHAQKVLVAFGRAYGALPESTKDINSDQYSFLDETISGLAHDRKIVSVRLALFGEMVKGKPWAPPTLKAVGGTEGIGLTFLEETFSASTAPPEHRLHQKAARAALKALLPESGTDIKGQMRSRQELLEASGYGSRPRTFDDLIHILDPELRLITPTDPEGSASDTQATRPGGQYYQLAHDYLVHSLRDWLTRKQRETRRGRAELRLAERAALWQAKPEYRQLPSWWEYLTAVWLVPAKNRTAVQQAMLREAGRLHAVRWGSALVVLSLIGFVIGKLLASERQSSLRQRVSTALDAVQNGRGPVVPFTVRDLEQLPRALVVAELKTRYANAKSEQKLALAYAMAQYGDVDVPFLVTQLELSAPEEVHNLVAAFRWRRKSSLNAMHMLAKTAAAQKNWRLKVRAAVVALHLEDDRIAADMCRIDERPDPIQRTIFIEELPAWHGDCTGLARYCQARSDAALRSGLLLALGSGSIRLNLDERAAWAATAANLHKTASDGGTHSAAGWVLRQWGLETPALAATSEPKEGCQWLVNSLGMTLLEIKPREFVRKDTTPEAKEQTVKLRRACFMGDREISIGQFQQFINDASYPNAEKPEKWPGANVQISPTRDHPVQNVNLYDAVLFCNWLSRKEWRTPCYARTGKKEKVRKNDGQVVEHDEWRLVPGGTGYRLPAGAEWEYACRAGTTTEFASGSDEEILRKYAVFQASCSAPCGSKLPNGWGLFDMHGNVIEWSWDRYGQDFEPGVNIEGEAAAYRVVRGGSLGDPAALTQSSHVGVTPPESRMLAGGFRVVRGQSGG